MIDVNSHTTVTTISVPNLPSGLAMTPDERVKLILALRDRGLNAIMAARNIDRDTAIEEIKRSRRLGRRYSRSMDD